MCRKRAKGGGKRKPSELCGGACLQPGGDSGVPHTVLAGGENSRCPILPGLKGLSCRQVVFSPELQTGPWAQRPSKKVVPPCPLPKELKKASLNGIVQTQLWDAGSDRGCSANPLRSSVFSVPFREQVATLSSCHWRRAWLL